MSIFWFYLLRDSFNFVHTSWDTTLHMENVKGDTRTTLRQSVEVSQRIQEGGG